MKMFRIGAFVALVALLGFSVFYSLHSSDQAGFALAATSIIPVVQRNKRFRHLGTMIPGSFPSQQTLQIPKDFVYSFLRLRMQAQVDVAAGGGADGALAAEQPWSLIRQLRLVGSSPARPSVSEIKSHDLAAAAVLQRMMTGTTPNSAALSIPGIQAASIVSANCVLPFELPRCVNPRAGGLNVHELNALDLVCEWGTDTDIIVGGTRVTTLSNASLQVSGEEYLDQITNSGKFAVLTTRYIEQTISAASTRLVIDLKRGFITRGLLIKQFTRTAIPHTPVNTVINAVSIEVNGAVKLDYRSNGTANSGWALLQAQNKEDYALETSPTGYAFIDLSRDGYLDTLIKTNDYSNISVVLDVNAIGSSVVRVYPVEIIDIDQ